MKLQRTEILIAFSFITALSLLFFWGTYTANRKNKPNKRMLFKEIFTNGALFIYPSHTDYTPAENENRFNFGYAKINLKYIADTSVNKAMLKNNSLVITGDPSNNALLAKTLNRFGISITDNSVKIDKYYFTGDSLTVSLVAPNPFNKNKLCFILAGKQSSLANNGRRFVADLEIKNGTTALFLSDIDYSKFNGGKIYLKNVKDLRLPVTDYSFDDKLLISVYGELTGRENINSLANRYLRGVDKFTKFINTKTPPPKITVHIYSSFEQKGLKTNNTDLSCIIEEIIHTVVNEDVNGADLFSLNKLLTGYYWKEPKHQFIKDAVAAYLTDNRLGIDKYELAARIISADMSPELSSLFDNSVYNFESNYSSQSIGALFVKFILEKFGKEKLKSIYKNGLQSEEYKRINNDWIEYQSQFTKRYKIVIKPKISTPDFLNGFCFAHEGYQIHNGYLSNEAVKSLQRLKTLGANAISVTPFTGMSKPNKLTPLRIWSGAGTENDESIIFASTEAAKLGMITLLKPHIYLHNSWPGAIDFGTEAEWTQFLNYYERWIKHYALLAQIYDIPVFVIGNELSNAAIKYPDFWRVLIRKIDVLYDGYLTYGANWGSEIENIEFWDQLDFIGLSEYYPLSKKLKASQNELEKGMENILIKLKKISGKFNKPIIFTEIGFRSSAAPWMSSFEPESSKSVIDFGAQNRAFDAVFSQMQNAYFIRGIFIWKWPSYLDYNVKQSYDAYTPLNKPAELTIKRFFGKTVK